MHWLALFRNILCFQYARLFKFWNPGQSYKTSDDNFGGSICVKIIKKCCFWLFEFGNSASTLLRSKCLCYPLTYPSSQTQESRKEVLITNCWFYDYGECIKNNYFLLFWISKWSLQRRFDKNICVIRSSFQFLEIQEFRKEVLRMFWWSVFGAQAAVHLRPLAGVFFDFFNKNHEENQHILFFQLVFPRKGTLTLTPVVGMGIGGDHFLFC